MVGTAFVMNRSVHQNRSVRALVSATLNQYRSVFEADLEIALIDCRLTRRGFNGQFDPSIGAYRHAVHYTYSDVGLFHVQRLEQMSSRFDNFNDPFVASKKADAQTGG